MNNSKIKLRIPQRTSQPNSANCPSSVGGVGSGASPRSHQSELDLAATVAAAAEANGPATRLTHRQSRLYADAVSVFRAQGPLTESKRDLLRRLRALLGVSDARHQVECRRAAGDPELATIAARTSSIPSASVSASSASCGRLIIEADWVEEAGRAAPLMSSAVAAAQLSTSISSQLSIISETVATAVKAKTKKRTAPSAAQNNDKQIKKKKSTTDGKKSQQIRQHPLPILPRPTLLQAKLAPDDPSVSASVSPPIEDLAQAADPDSVPATSLLPPVASAASALPSAVGNLPPSAFSSTFTWGSSSVNSFAWPIGEDSATARSASHLQHPQSLQHPSSAALAENSSTKTTSNGSVIHSVHHRRKQQFRQVATPLPVAIDNNDALGDDKYGYDSVRIRSGMETLLESDSEADSEDLNRLSSLIDHRPPNVTILAAAAAAAGATALPRSSSRPCRPGGKMKR